MSVLRLLPIVLLSVLGAVIYGIIHDQITARICVEYFTIGHLPVFNTDDPTLLGLGWGVIATWWVGLILGIPLALVATVGSRPRVGASQLIRPMAVMLLVLGALAALAGLIGHVAARLHWVWLVEPFASLVPPERHVAFLTDLWAHLASYIGGAIGGVCLCWYVVIQRRRAGCALNLSTKS